MDGEVRETQLCLSLQMGVGTQSASFLSGRNSRQKGENMKAHTFEMFRSMSFISNLICNGHIHVWLEQERVYADELEEYFYSVFESQLFTSCEDGSIEEVCAQLCLLPHGSYLLSQVSRLLADLYNKIASDDLSLLTTLLNQKVSKGTAESRPQNASIPNSFTITFILTILSQVEDDDSEEEGEDEEVTTTTTTTTTAPTPSPPTTVTNNNSNSQQSAPMEDDGWTVVGSKGKGKK